MEAAVSDGKVFVWLEPGYYFPPSVLDHLNELAGDSE